MSNSESPNQNKANIPPVNSNDGGTTVDKNIDDSRLSTKQQDEIAWFTSEEKRSRTVGFANSKMVIPLPTYRQSGNELVLRTEQSNAGIVIARDRPASIFSGYGGIGHQKCSTIDIVAGRMSFMSRTSFVDDKNEEVPFVVDPNFEFDAARIYVSEKTDIDKNFQLRTQEAELSGVFQGMPESIGRSAVGIKADSIRVIGNEGVKIVTGVYETNSRGGTATPAGIELVALNGNEGAFAVQPFVKGANLQSSLYDLHQEIRTTNKLLSEFITFQQSLNVLFAHHNHNTSVGGDMSPPALGKPDDFYSPYIQFNRLINKLGRKLDTQLKNLQRWEKVWLSPESKTWILSRYNGTN